ncbi:MAG: preprotein translocase subunit YajC [Chlamydiota bacterium]
MKKKFIYILPLLMATSLFADGEPAAPVRQSNSWSMMLMVGLGLVFFYLILFRPEQKRRKKMEEMRRSLVKGSRVTAMGILGTVVRVEEKTVVLKMVDGNQIEMLKEVITKVQPGLSEQRADASDS